LLTKNNQTINENDDDVDKSDEDGDDCDINNNNSLQAGSLVWVLHD